MLVEVEGAPQRGERSLRALVSLAYPTARPDRSGDVARQVQSLRVDEPVCVPEFAAQPDRESLARLTISRRPSLDSARHPHVAAAIGHLGDLDQDLARVGEGLVDVPQRAGAALD